MNIWIDVGVGSYGVSFLIRASPRWSFRQLQEAVLRRIFLDRRYAIEHPWVLYDHVIFPPHAEACLTTDEELDSPLYSHDVRQGDHLLMLMRIAHLKTRMLRSFPCHPSEFYAYSILPPCPESLKEADPAGSSWCLARRLPI